MLLACTILVLAWSIGSVTKDVDLSGFVVSSIKEGTSFSLVPGIIFIVGALISFATGTSWGTMAILTPIAIPIAYKLTVDAWVSVTVMSGVVFAGSIFTVHLYPIRQCYLPYLPAAIIWIMLTHSCHMQFSQLS